ncbi:pyruvate dehydrogenase complex dihydrolipoamide acetyltransferase [Novosphingobium colocasiae]|uniref:Acetyltransferase component of pyruvate dehydrogenase complex n=1 Tax=Novosphingobium colocasiae TaxID=1256513 RepID=A0A918PB84_9SPHN|nr:pyruvate dehydrogenase complex dihydrolipoamide acetyltransferase [Novosphingobium colocasiae]GGY97009.1 acetyltransferase component of pyruvate dehydrogenase complex [Novosphingobium colocasiae]
MPIEIKMPALSPTMEEGKLAKWLVKEGDAVSSGDILAEIETDKATMEFEAADEGTVGKILIAEGTEGVKVGTVIATLSGEDDGEAPVAKAAPQEVAAKPAVDAAPAPAPQAAPAAKPAPAPVPKAAAGNRVVASPLARRIAAAKNVDLASVTGSGPHGRIVKADVEGASSGAPAPAKQATAPAAPAIAAAPAADAAALVDARVPHTIDALSGMRKTIARRLTQSKQEAPHIYLTVDVVLDPLLALRAQVNAALERRGIKVSVNDMLIKALGLALIEVPECNVAFAGNDIIRYQRADISVAVSIPNGLITPIVTNADGRPFSQIALATRDLATRAKEGKLKPEEYQGGTASISNMGMLGIKQFAAVLNPPQATIMAIGAGERRPWVMPDDTLGVATVMSATGSFDHRAIDGADAARLMQAFKALIEKPLGMVA